MFRSAFVAIALALFSTPAIAQTQQPDSLTLTLPEARATAKAALHQGDYALALKLGKGLLFANPVDSDAHFIVAVAQAGLGKPREGRVAARRAFQNAKRPQEKFFAAQTAARLSLGEEQYTLAQYWLRRSIDSAPSPELRAQTISDFHRVQSLKRFDWRARFSVVPSDNVNSGTDDTHLVIDGLAAVGLLDDASRPLSGVVARADISLSYRLKQSDTALWQLTGRAYQREVFLSSSAKSIAPDVSGRELSSATYEAGIARYSRTQPNGKPVTSHLQFSLGRNLSGGHRYSDFAKLSASRGYVLGKGQKFTIGGSYKKVFYKNGVYDRADQFQLRGDYERRLDNGNKLITGLVLGHVNSQRGNTSNNSLTGYVTYEFAERLGPAAISATLGARFTDYPNYYVGFLTAPGGRQDKHAFGTLNLRFEDFEIAGFVPTAALEYHGTSSNISRFETSGASLSFGFASSF